MAIIPAARSLYICEGFIGDANGRVDLVGLYNAVNVANGFPYRSRHFTVFAQLANGLGLLPVHVEIRDASTNELIYATKKGHVSIPNRITIVQLAVSINGCVFPRPGIYLVQLVCDNVWVCDTTLQLRE